MKALAVNRLILLLVTTVILLQPHIAKACDACSSNMGSFYPGFADFGNSFVSFNTVVRTYGVYVPSGYRWMTSFGNNQNGGHQHPAFEKSAYYDQSHLFHELRFSYSVEKITIGVMMPVVQKKLFRNDELIENNTGLGDMRFTLLFNALKRTSKSGNVTNRLFAGAGFSIPTGESSQPGYDGMVEPSRQTGMGTFALFVNAAYQLNVKQFGVHLQSVFQTADADSKGYRFGNAFNLLGRAYYEVKIARAIITPSVGVNLEMAGEDRLNGEKYSLDTGGRRVFCPAGVDVFYKSFGASFTWYLPVSEKLNGLQFESKQYFSAGVRYVFKKT